MTAGSVRTERHEAVLSIVLDRPETRNALSTPTLRRIVDLLDEATVDRDVRAVVLTGEGPVFASGADVRELRDTAPAEYLASDRRRAWDAMAGFTKPLVAAVRGYALGGGCELALRCDAIVAGESAVLGQPEVRLGIVAGAGGAQWWTRIAGRYQAGAILMTGRWVPAYEARRLGIVTVVVPDEAVRSAARRLAADIAECAPIAVRATKAMIAQAYAAPLPTALAHDRLELAAMLATDDHVEGMTAFLKRRAPRFEGC